MISYRTDTGDMEVFDCYGELFQCRYALGAGNVDGCGNLDYIRVQEHQ